MIMFSYPALITSVESDAIQMVVSVDGKDMVLQTKPDRITIEVHEDMRIRVEGDIENGQKVLRYRKIKPLKLDKEDIDALHDIVAAYENI